MVLLIRVALAALVVADDVELSTNVAANCCGLFYFSAVAVTTVVSCFVGGNDVRTVTGPSVVAALLLIM